MTKDRLPDLKAAQYESDNEMVEIVLETNTKLFMEEFFKQVEFIRTNVEQIVNCVGDVRRLHIAMLTDLSGDNKNKDELDERMLEIKKSAQKVRQKLKEMEKSNSDYESQNKTQNAEFRIRKMQFSFLSHELSEAIGVYNNVQMEHRENCKKQIIRQIEINGQKKTDEEIETMLETGNPQVFIQSILMETKMAKQTLEELQARHQDLLKLEESIRELHEMFMDLAMIIESQGEMIDNVERNMINALEYVESAKQETAEAVTYQSAARRKKICLIVTLIIFIIVVISIVLIVIFTKVDFTGNKKPKPPPTEPPQTQKPPTDPPFLILF